MFFVHGVTGQTFRGTLEGSMPLAATLKARDALNRDETVFGARERPLKSAHEKQSNSDEPSRFTLAARAYDEIGRASCRERV